MKQNILLIYPPHREQVTASEVPPLGLAYLASFIRGQMKENCKVSIWDLNLHRVTQEEFRKKLLSLDEKPEIIGIGGIVTVFRHFLWLSKICKEIFPDSLLISGGSLASTVPHLLFKHSPVDICVKGEGEITLLEIMAALKNGAGKSDMKEIKGIFLWDENEGKMINTPPRPPISDLDIIGMPAYDLIDLNRYARNFSGYNKDLPAEVLAAGNRHLSIMTSRGCTDRCTFCYRQFPKIGMNSIDFVKRHVSFLHSQFGINIFSFIDELFNLSEKRINELCRGFMEIKEKIPGFFFRAEGRADIVNAGLLKKLKAAGCFQIVYGLESGSPKMLKLMKKRITVDQNRNAVIAAREAGLHCVPQFLVGLPGENKETLKETINFIKSVDFWSYVCIHKANAYPGSEIYRYAQDKGMIRDEFSYISSLTDSAEYPLQLAEISEKEIMRIVRKFLITREIALIFRNNHPVRALFILIKWAAGIISRKFKNSLKKAAFIKRGK